MEAFVFNLSLNKHKRSLQEGRMRGARHEWRSVKDTDEPVRTALYRRAGRTAPFAL